MGFIGSILARTLVEFNNKVTLIDNLIPEHGGNPRNLHDLEDKISINLFDIRDENTIQEIIKGHDFLFNLAPSDPFKLVPIEKPISMSASKHIGYAIQWFGLSVVLVVMTLIAFLKKNE